MIERTTLRGALIGGAALAAALDAVYYFGGLTGQRDDTPLRASLVAAAGAALAALLIYRFGRRAFADGRGTLALAALAAFSFAGFWIGVFGPLCVAAALAGRRALAAGRTKAGAAALAAAVLAGGVSAVLCVLGAS